MCSSVSTIVATVTIDIAVFPTTFKYMTYFRCLGGGWFCCIESYCTAGVLCSSDCDL